MNIKDQISSRPIRVDHRCKRSTGAIVNEVSSTGVVCTGQQNHLRRGPSISDRSDDLLYRSSPGFDIEVMRLVHDAEDDLALALVFGRQCCPKGDELRIRWTTLSNDGTIPTGVVVNVNDTVSAQGQTALHQSVILAKVVRVQRATKVISNEELPSRRQAENVEGIIVDEVPHLSDTAARYIIDLTLVLSTTGHHTKVEASDVDTSESDFARRYGGT